MGVAEECGSFRTAEQKLGIAGIVYAQDQSVYMANELIAQRGIVQVCIGPFAFSNRITVGSDDEALTIDQLGMPVHVMEVCIGKIHDVLLPLAVTLVGRDIGILRSVALVGRFSDGRLGGFRLSRCEYRGTFGNRNAGKQNAQQQDHRAQASQLFC